MKTDETATKIAVQPETEVEQSLLAELFKRLAAISDAPDHPEKVGNQLVYYTLDMSEYDGLDHDLADEAECGVNEHGQLDPEPGSRALVIIHAPDAEFAEAADEARDEADDAEEATSEEVEEAVEASGDDGGHPTEDEIDEAVEGLQEGEDEDNEYTVDPANIVKEIKAADDLEEVDYRQLQAWAQDISTTGVMDIPANQSTEDLIDDISQFVEVADPEVSA